MWKYNYIVRERPQAKSIRAALHPENTKALYFVAKGISPTEGHVFTNNLNDHNKAVFEYRKKVKNYKLFDEKGSDNSESSVADSNGDDTVSESAAESDSESEKTASNNKTTPELKDYNSSSVESSKAETPESESKAAKADSPKESIKTPSTKSSKNKWSKIQHL